MAKSTLLLFLALFSATFAQEFPENFCETYKQREIVNEKCRLQLAQVCERPETLLQMLDATSKLPSGILLGNVVDFGSFDECMGIEVLPSPEGKILGKYCVHAVQVPLVNETALSLAACIPDACEVSDILPAVSSSVRLCQTRETLTTMDWADWTVTGVFVFVGLLLVVGTAFDWYFESRGETIRYPLLVSFSVLSNGRKIVATSNSPDQLHCLNGIRFVSMLWVIAGHRFVSMQAYPLINFIDAFEWMDKLYTAYLQGARVAVDTFFFLSAFLTSYMYFKNVDKNPLTVAKIPFYYLHRLLRITPALAAVYFFQVTIFKFFSYGPLFPAIYDMGRETCLKYWWTFFLYIQNYYNPGDDSMCIVPTWYLSADMHMFLLSPLFVLPMGYLVNKGKVKLAYVYIWVLIALAMFVPMTIDFFREKYNEYETHTRLAGYLVGIFMGMFVALTRDKKIRIRQSLNLLIWAVCLSGMLTIILCTNDVRNHQENLKWNLFHTFSRPGWAVGLSWVIWACITDHGGVVNWLLSRPIFQVTGRLSYSMYLLHSTVIMASVGYQRSNFHFSDYSVMYLWCGDFIFTLLISVLWVLAFESPIIGVEKVLFGIGKPQKKINNVA